MKHLVKYLQYIVNTGMNPIAVALFDEDWEPIGPLVRHDMQKLGWIEETTAGAGIKITPTGRATLENANDTR